jgi:hypothetical protein
VGFVLLVFLHVFFIIADLDGRQQPVDHFQRQESFQNIINLVNFRDLVVVFQQHGMGKVIILVGLDWFLDAHIHGRLSGCRSQEAEGSLVSFHLAAQNLGSGSLPGLQ